MSEDCLGVKSYPEISLEVMRRRLEPQYRVWLLARHLDPGGRGCVTVGQLHRFVSRHHLCGPRVLQRALAHESVFFTRHHDDLWLRGLLKVARSLEVELHDRPTWIPLDDLSSMQRFRQALVASYFAHKPRTVAIDTLAALTGRSRRSVARYLSSEHVVKTPNVMYSRRDPNTPLTPEMAQEGYFHSRLAGGTILVKRLPNTYETDLEPAAYGKVKQQRLSACSTPTGHLDRLYYAHPQGAARALQSLSPHRCLYLRSYNCFDDLGFQLWRGYYCLDPTAPNHEL